jgi:poly(glycerol-phosphate) alpha-glucosyltransferase
MKYSEKFKVFFLNLDVNKEITGIESAAMIRGRIMDQYLDLPTEFISIYFNLMSQKYFQNYQKLGLASARMNRLNVFDWIHGETTLFSEELVPFKVPTGCTLASVEGTPHDQRLYKRGEILAYLKYDEDENRLLYVNYLRKGKIWKRDWFGLKGRIYRTDYVDPHYETPDPVVEMFWGHTGHLAMMRDYEFSADKKRTMRSIQSMKSDQIDQCLEDMDELHELFLESQLDQNKVNVLILDRSKEYLKPAMRLRDKYPDRVKLVTLIHNTHYVHGTHEPGDPMTSEVSSFYKEVLFSPDKFSAIVFLTNAQVADVQKRFGPGAYHVIPHAVPMLTPSKGLTRDMNKIVIPGRFAEEKQLYLAIEAFKLIHERVPDATLHFYGYGGKRDQMQDLIKTYQLDAVVSINEFSADIASIFQGAGLMMCSSRNEGFSISMLQSIQHRCPLISFDCAYGPAELIQDGINGFLVKPQSVQDLADTVCKVLLDPILHQQLIDQCEQSLREFREDRVAKRWANLLDDLLKS